MEVGLAGAPGCGFSELAQLQEKHQEASHKGKMTCPEFGGVPYN